MNKNNFLNNAKKQKRDEFYTQYEDIEKEMVYYKDCFKNKVVLCNCNDGENSNFYRYFCDNFSQFGLKKLISISYGERPYKLEVEDGVTTKIELESGDFRKNVLALAEADIVVTNPPFSMFREFLLMLMEYDKKFIILGNINTLFTKDIFPYVVENKLRLGVSIHSGDVGFFVPNENYSYYKPEELARVPSVRWITNIDHGVKLKKIELVKTYNEKDYPKYDTFDAININSIRNIPKDYEGLMGVPITYLERHRREDFEIVGILTHGRDNKYDFAVPMVNGKEKYKRLVIKNLNPVR